jgi:SAM-dependent methyltransferase
LDDAGAQEAALRQTPERWWEGFFDEVFARLMMPDEPDAEELAFLVERAGARPGARVYDQCCGEGRVAIELAARGCEVVGVDASRAYVARGRARAAARGVACELRVGDAFEVVVAPECDVVLNWHTSFGYTEDDALNARMLERAYASLAPGGRMVLDYGNAAFVLGNFQPATTMRLETPAGEWMAVRESSVDLEAGMLRQLWTFVSPQGEVDRRRGDTRLYLPHTLKGMLEAVGFVDVELFGDRKGGPLGPESSRCLALGRRPHERE